MISRLKIFSTLTFFIAYGQTTFAQDDKPNVVIFFTDDQGYADVGSFGATDFETPHLDQLAREGARFTSFYSASSVCSPSRAALLTGCYPMRVGLTDVLLPWTRQGLHSDEITMAEMLKENGYATACFGKWHLGHQKKFLPLQHGFDEYFGLPYSNDMRPDMDPEVHPNLPLIEGNEIVEYNPSQSLLTNQYTDKAIDFIERNKDEPFFVYLPYTMPHIPLYVSPEYRNRSKKGVYGDVIMEIDGSVGRIVDKLKALELEQQTLVIFTSDNGPWLAYGSHGGNAFPLREGKFTTFEGGQRVPCIMWMPGNIEAGFESDQVMSTIDLLPTIASFTGATVPDHMIDGEDMSEVLTSKIESKEWDKPFYYLSEDGLQAVRQGRWKLHRPHYYESVSVPGTDGRVGEGIENRISWALYDLDEDIGEKINIADLHPEVVERLKNLMNQFEEEIESNQRPSGKI
ncbi:MAG: sulfatase [Bacteroidota bacterium]